MKFLYCIIFFIISAQSFADDVPVPAGHVINDECKQFIEQIKTKYDYNWIQTKAIPVNLNQTIERKSNTSFNPDVFVFYYYKKATLVNGQLKNPIAHYNGGPGYSSHGLNDLLEVARVKHQIKTELNFIFIDQRGTGCSSPYPRGIELSVLELLKWYGSQGIVYDSELIRQKLVGSNKWKIFGQSFGAHIVFRYLSLFPQSISKAYAHGNAIGITDEDRSFYRIMSQYTVTESYLKVYPQDRKRLFAFRLALSDKNKCLKNKIREYCGFEMMTPLIYSLGFTDNWPSVHAWLVNVAPLSTVDEAGLQTYVDNYITTPAFYYQSSVTPQVSDHSLNISLNFLGLFDWSSRPLAAKICTEAYNRIQQKLKVSTDALLLDECKAPVQFDYVDQIEPAVLAEMPNFTPDFLQPTQVLEQIVKNKVTVFTYSGGMDCYVPKEAFAIQNKVFGKKVQYTFFPNSGHDGYLEERQVYVDLTK